MKSDNKAYKFKAFILIIVILSWFNYVKHDIYRAYKILRNRISTIDFTPKTFNDKSKDPIITLTNQDDNYDYWEYDFDTDNEADNFLMKTYQNNFFDYFSINGGENLKTNILISGAIQQTLYEQLTCLALDDSYSVNTLEKIYETYLWTMVIKNK